jgi:hypothetical protein
MSRKGRDTPLSGANLLNHSKWLSIALSLSQIYSVSFMLAHSIVIPNSRWEGEREGGLWLRLTLHSAGQTIPARGNTNPNWGYWGEYQQEDTVAVLLLQHIFFLQLSTDSGSATESLAGMPGYVIHVPEWKPWSSEGGWPRVNDITCYLPAALGLQFFPVHLTMP